MRVASITPDRIEIRGRGGVHTPLIVGGVLFAWPFLASAMAGSPPTGDRLVAGLVVLALGAVLVWFGWPGRRVIRIERRERLLEARGGAPFVIPDGANLRLIAAPAQPVAGALRYGVALEAPGREPLLILVGKDPAVVLTDVVLLREKLSLPVLAGWGLSPDALPWLTASATARDPLRTALEDDPVEPTRRRATTALGVGTAGATALLALEISGRASRGDVASPISLLLPALGICLLATLTFVLGSLKPRVSAGAALSFEWRLGTLRLFTRSVAASSVESAEVVSPTGNAARHLLVSTTFGTFLAFPCDGTEGATVAAAISSEVRRGS